MTVYQRLADRLAEKGFINSDEQDIYAYGFDIVSYTIWSTAVLLIIGLIFRKIWDTVVIVAIFYTFQCMGGGYHAKTHLKCLLTMVLSLTGSLIFCYLKIDTVILWSMIGLGTILLLAFPLVLHPNKAYLEERRKSLSIRSVIVTICTLLVTVIICILLALQG